MPSADIHFSCFLLNNVADPGSLSQILIFSHPDLGSRIQLQQELGGGNFSVLPFFGSLKVHEFENYLIFEQAQKKICVSFQRIKVFFTQNVASKLSRYMGWGSWF